MLIVEFKYYNLGSSVYNMDFIQWSSNCPIVFDLLSIGKGAVISV